MARLARVVVPGIPHHVTQRGNGCARTFFSDEDYALYRDLLAEHCRKADVEVWAWCLMPNHVHLILVPFDADGLRRALAGVHRRYAGGIHARRRRTGHFWQGRFGTVAMDEAHLAAALRYVSLNPVRAGLVARARAEVADGCRRERRRAAGSVALSVAGESSATSLRWRGLCGRAIQCTVTVIPQGTRLRCIPCNHSDN